MPHPKTGTVRINNCLWKIPELYLCPRQRLRIATSLLDPDNVWLIDSLNRRICLQKALRITPAATQTTDSAQQNPQGPLSALLESYHGRTLPQAIAGFGLPEIYKCLAAAVGRNVPDTLTEANLILRWLKLHGPFQPQSFSAAVDAALKQLGNGRALSQLLDQLTRRINNPLASKDDHL